MQLEQMEVFAVDTEELVKSSMPTYVFCKKEGSTETTLDDTHND